MSQILMETLTYWGLNRIQIFIYQSSKLIASHYLHIGLDKEG